MTEAVEKGVHTVVSIMQAFGPLQVSEVQIIYRAQWRLQPPGVPGVQPPFLLDLRSGMEHPQYGDRWLLPVLVHCHGQHIHSGRHSCSSAIN